MMDYRILKDGELINTIVASEEFVSSYCAENGYTYEPVSKPEPEPEPTTDELLNILLGVTADG